MTRIIIILILLLLTGCTNYEQIAIEQQEVIDQQQDRIHELQFELFATQEQLEIAMELYESIPDPPKPFPNEQALQEFLASDTTSDTTYSEDYDCVDFTLDLIQNAGEKGYYLFPYVIIEQKHLVCGTFVYDDLLVQIILIEPQTDEYVIAGWFDRVKLCR